MDERDDRLGEARNDASGRDHHVAPVHLDGTELTRAALIALAGRAEGDPDRSSRPLIWSLEAEAIAPGIEPGADRRAFAGSRSPSPRLSSDEASRLLANHGHRGRSANRRVGPIPEAGLVTIESSDGARLLVDLVASGVTSVSGDILDRKSFIRQLIDELADRRWAPLNTVVVVGATACSDARLARGGVRVVADLAALDAWRSTANEPSKVIRPSTRSGSLATVVVIGPGAIGDREAIDHLLATRHEGPGDLAVVIAGPWPSAVCTVAVDIGAERGDVSVRVPLPDHGGAGRAAPRPDRAPLLARAVRPDARPGEVSTRFDPPDASEPDAEHDRPDVVPPPLFLRRRVEEQTPSPSPLEREEIEVAVLGRVEVRGVDGTLARRPKLTELVVFLALHPNGATTDAWTTALWPGRQVPLQTIANRLSETRGLLGFASDGRPRLRRSGELHRVSEVTTDWARFRELAAPTASLDSWRAALELVRGRPFEDLSSNLWTAIECTAVTIEQAIIECALRVGHRLLELDDPNGATAAAHCGLRASPWDEPLHRLLMLAADATGNRAGVEATLRHLALVLEVEGDPLRHVHPETAELYSRLLGRPRRTITV